MPRIDLDDEESDRSTFADGLIGPDDALFSWHLLRALRRGIRSGADHVYAGVVSARLARCNGTVVVETDRGIGLVEQGGGWITIAIFVLGLLGLLLGIAGVGLVVSGVIGALGMVGGAALAIALVVLLIKKKRALATAELGPPWLVIDLEARMVISHGKPPIPLAELRLARVFQAGSSSKALALRGVTKIVIARGNPFGDEVDDVERVLRTRGVA